jgi:hypothetical protein
MRSFIICIHPQMLLGRSNPRRMRRVGHVARMGGERKVYKVLVGKPKGKRSLGRQRRRWENGIEWILERLAGGS